MNRREGVWSQRHREIMKITSRRKGSLQWATAIWRTSEFRCSKRCKFQMRKLQWTRNERSSKSCQQGQLNSPLCHKNGLQWESVKEDSEAFAVFTEQGSSASQMTAAKVMNVIARLLDFAGQAADAVSAYTQVKMEDAPRLLKSSRVGISRYMDTSSTTQVVQILEQYRRPSGFSWEILVRTPTCRTLMVGTVRRSSVGTCMGESTEFGMLVLFIGNKDCSCRYTWTTSTWLERNRIWSPYGRNWWNWSILENQRHFLTTCIWDVFNVSASRTKGIIDEYRKNVRITNFCYSNWKMPGRETLHEKTVAWSYDMEGHAKKVRWKILWLGE